MAISRCDEALEADAIRRFPYRWQAIDRMIYVIGKQNEDDAQLCYPYPPKKDFPND